MTNMPGRGGVSVVRWLPSVACHGNCEPSKDTHQETNHTSGIRPETEAGPRRLASGGEDNFHPRHGPWLYYYGTSDASRNAGVNRMLSLTQAFGTVPTR